MKIKILQFILIGLCISCQNTKTNDKVFGQAFETKKALTNLEVENKYNSLRENDTINMKMIAMVEDVCQAKGCWMKLKFKDDEHIMVRFKDYGFFVPKDLSGKEVIVNGKAYVEAMSVEDQKHYALDAKKTEDEINAITVPKKTFAFIADGVLLKQ